MSKTYDVIVVGVGGMGAAACHQLARRGQRVLGLEKFAIGRCHGLLARADAHPASRLFRGLGLCAAGSGRATCGSRRASASASRCSSTGAPGDRREPSDHIERSRQSCLDHGLAHTLPDRDAVERRYPAFRLPKDSIALFQPESGFVA